MRIREALIGCAFLVAGCNSQTMGNSVLRPPPDEKAKAAAILKEHGVEDEIVAMQNDGDAWVVSVASAPTQTVKGELTVLATPASYKVIKTGRVVSGDNGKELPRK